MRPLLVLAAAVLSGACRGAPADTADRAALDSIRAESIRAHMQFLADDVLEGRRTGERGYDIAARYVAAQMTDIGLEPAFDGSWYQAVPFQTSEIVGDATLVLEGGGSRRSLVRDQDFVMAPSAFDEQVSVEAPVVYVGYGITAPETGHDDYAGVDVKGRIVAMLSGAPATFPNHLRAFYSQSREKNGNAAARGAVGALVFSDPAEDKRFPFDLIVRGGRTPDYHWIDESGTPVGVPRALQFRARLSRSGAEALVAHSGRALEDLFAGAASGQLGGVPLNVSARVELTSRHGRVESPNVAGILRGSDPARRDEYLTYVAHLDHLGVSPGGEGDRIHNGAYDNASGVAIMLEVADAFAQLRPRPARSILFLAVTGEEMGLLGAEYFVHRPPVPVESIVANISLDMFLMLFPLRDVIAFGAEHSTLGAVAERAATELGVAVSPDPIPEEVIFIRSDQFRFVEKGVPALFLVHGLESGDPSRNGATITARWRRERYHRPGDDMDQAMDFQAGVDFGKLNLLIGRDIADATARPSWNEGDFFGGRFTSAR